jgi:hypothetical protein
MGKRKQKLEERSKCVPMSNEQSLNNSSDMPFSNTTTPAVVVVSVVLVVLVEEVAVWLASTIFVPAQGCYKGVTRVLQGCYKGVTRVLQGCYKGVASKSQACYKGVLATGNKLIVK